jgi:hypothetical protein
VYHTAPAGLYFGAGPSCAAGMSSTGARHDKDVPEFSLDLDTMADVLSQLEDAPNLMQPSEPL